MTLQRGFTLLELLVVMVLMGLVTTLALPAMQRWHDAVQNKAQVASIVDALRAAGFSAGATRRDIVVDSGSFQQAAQPAAAASGPRPVAGLTERLALTLPAGWSAEQVDEIRFLANGLCSPGTVRLRTERGDVVEVQVRGPLCGVELAQGAATGAR